MSLMYDLAALLMAAPRPRRGGPAPLRPAQAWRIAFTHAWFPNPSGICEIPRDPVYYGDLLLPAAGLHGSEKQFADSVLGDLAPYFCMQREVAGWHPTGQAVRLDAVLRPRVPGAAVR